MDLEFAIKVYGAISPKHITALLLKSSKAGTAKRKSALWMHTSYGGPLMIYYGYPQIIIYCDGELSHSLHLLILIVQIQLIHS